MIVYRHHLSNQYRIRILHKWALHLLEKRLCQMITARYKFEYGSTQRTLYEFRANAGTKSS